MSLSNRLYLYVKLSRLDRPIGVLLLLWPTLWGLWIAGQGKPSWWIALIFVCGTLLTRSAGCVLNDVADRNIDRHVKRTKDRPITAGDVSVSEAVYLATGLLILAFIVALPLNSLTLWLTLPALLLLSSYPYTKRFVAIPQAYLGIAFSFGIPMAFAAQTNHVPNVAWELMLANFFWCIAYDTEYAMVDRDDDKHLGIHSSALFFGNREVLAIMLCYFVSIACLYLVGKSLNLGSLYILGLIVALCIAFYHFLLIRTRTREGCLRAFLHNNWFGAAVFLGLYFDFYFQ